MFISNLFMRFYIHAHCVKILDIMKTSEILGTLKDLFDLWRIEAAIKTKAEFLAPLILIFPSSNSPPFISKYLLFKKNIFENFVSVSSLYSSIKSFKKFICKWVIFLRC